MKYTVKEFSDNVRSIIGDGTFDIPEQFIIDALNWAFNELPRIPKLEKLFSSHEQATLDAKGHYRWNLNGGVNALNIDQLKTSTTVRKEKYLRRWFFIAIIKAKEKNPR